MPELSWESVRRDIVGADASIATPYGRRRLLYADHTASGRAVRLIEEYLLELLATYGNTHTEDDATGRLTTLRLREAAATVKRLVNAGPQHKVIFVGTGSTGAVNRLQEILGVYLPPATRDRLHVAGAAGGAARPVVFVGPYEHHSNEVSWRECFADVEEIDLDARGVLDLRDLETHVGNPAHAERPRIGAFSACSNVSGLLTPVHEVARILHRHGCLACFDFAASAPYHPIDMRRGDGGHLDAVYFSPHKFLGGPGASGVLVIDQAIYRRDLPPTIAGGGTVDFVNPERQDYLTDIEARESAGTPGILQTLRAALSMELAERLGWQAIAAAERANIRAALSRLARIPGVEIVGNPDPELRIAICSFMIRLDRGWLHPRFVTQLLNDLFGIQSRAGCTCAGPYGHRVLRIDGARSLEFRASIIGGHRGVKPGWTRLAFHFLLEPAEVDFLCDAVEFVARRGALFLQEYSFDPSEGGWRHRGQPAAEVPFGIDEALALRTAGQGDGSRTRQPAVPLAELFSSYLAEAERRAEALEGTFDASRLCSTDRSLVPFLYVHAVQ